MLHQNYDLIFISTHCDCFSYIQTTSKCFACILICRNHMKESVDLVTLNVMSPMLKINSLAILLNIKRSFMILLVICNIKPSNGKS